MRLILASVGVLILGAAALIFGWQQSEITHLRAQVAQQAEAAPPSMARLDRRMTRSNDAPLGLTSDERRFVLGQYQDALAQMNLPPTKAGRLQDLLARRIEVALDAQADAAREGFAQGSTEMTRAESSAIAGVDQEIASLLGADDDRRLVLLTTGAPPQPAAPAAPVVVNVINQAPAPAAYQDDSGQSSAYNYDAYPTPVPYTYTPAYYYYPYATVFIGRSFARPFAGERFGGDRFEAGRAGSARPEFGGGGAHLTRRGR